MEREKDRQKFRTEAKRWNGKLTRSQREDCCYESPEAAYGSESMETVEK